jgi:hypothetical protein
MNAKRENWLDAAICALAAVALALIPYLLHSRAYYQDDMQAQFMPMLVAIGHALRHGEWPTITLQILNGGALASEYQYALYNPVSLLADAIASQFSDLAAAAAFLAAFYYALLDAGTYLLARACGADRRFAILASVTFAANNFLFYWYASSWFSGLVGLTWVIWALAFVIRAAASRGSWVAAAFFSYLTLTAGWPHSVIILGLMTIVVAVGEHRRAGWRAAAAPISAVALAALAALPALLPLLAMGSVAARDEGTFNAGVLGVNLYGVLALSSPLQFGHFLGFSGFTDIATPFFFAGWYILPLAPLIQWSRSKPNPTLLTIGVIALLLAAATQGPEHLFVLRWPFRFLTYMHLAILVGFALAASAYGFRVTGRRLLLSIGLIGFGAVASLQVRPAVFLAVLGSAALILLMTMLSADLLHRSSAWAMTILIGGVVVIFVATHAVIPRNANLPDWHVASQITKTSELGSIPKGYTLVAGTFGPLDPAEHDAQKFGNMMLADNVPNLFGYSPIGFKKLANAYCMETQGLACPQALAHMVQKSGFGAFSWADVLKIDTIDLMNAPRRWIEFLRAAGWTCAEHGENRAACSRASPRPTLSGSLAYASPGLVADSRQGSTAKREIVDIRSRADRSDTLVFDRLAFPGYRASFAGQTLPIGETETGLIMIRLPEGAATGALVLSYTPPGQYLGFVAAAVSLIALIIGALIWPRFFRAPGERL